MDAGLHCLGDIKRILPWIEMCFMFLAMLFTQAFDKPATPCDLVSVDLLIRVYMSHQNTSAARTNFKSVSLPQNNPRCQMHCVCALPRWHFRSPCFFWPCSVNLLQPDYKEAVRCPLSVWQRCLPAFLCSTVHMGVWRTIWFSPTI